MPNAAAVPAAAYPYTSAEQFDGTGGHPDLRRRAKNDLTAILIAEANSTPIPASVITDPRREWAAACDLADAHLSIRFKFPLLAWPHMLTDLVNRIAGWHLAEIYGLAQAGIDNPEYLRYREAIKTLEQIRDRKLNPPGFQDSTQTVPDANPDGSTPRVQSLEQRGW